ncbi:MAG: lysine--tRNA ligase [Deltaproteobacteria bacterium]|nr:lysine--tRNA ligase [Deltaproteobacteria bacterium]
MTNEQKRYKSWPFEEAARIVRAGRGRLPETAVFETGFGPSGLPHIGTFAEVARTTWVRRAYEHVTGGKTALVAFSDDLDGLRKVPDNMPNAGMLREHLGKPLSDIPDPYGCCASYSGHMNGRLREFLDAFGFECCFRSSSEAYRRGDFNAGIKILLDNVEKVLEVILPTLQEENRERWSPFLPKCERCGKVYTTRVTAHRKDADAVDYRCDTPFGDVPGCGHTGTASIYNGGVKMGWKVDWALRWYCYGVSYEMYGKDLIPSAELSSRIVAIMGGKEPCGFFYELFLDEAGEKISKSRGNGVSVEQWLAYAPVESLAHFIYRDPRQAKKLYFEMIPRAMDEYLDQLRRYPEMEEGKRPDSPLWHIHRAGASVPSYASSVNFTMVNNLVAALGTSDRDLLLGFLRRYDPAVERFPEILGPLVDKGLRYYNDHILPNKRHRAPSDAERPLFLALRSKLSGPGVDGLDEKALQSLVFDVAREHGIEPPEFFAAIYQVLLGQERGPRFGSFARLVGIERVIALIDEHAGVSSSP